MKKREVGNLFSIDKSKALNWSARVTSPINDEKPDQHDVMDRSAAKPASRGKTPKSKADTTTRCTTAVRRQWWRHMHTWRPWWSWLAGCPPWVSSPGPTTPPPPRPPRGSLPLVWAGWWRMESSCCRPPAARPTGRRGCGWRTHGPDAPR